MSKNLQRPNPKANANGKSKKKKNQKRNRSANLRALEGGYIKLSPCAQAYAMALLNPWDARLALYPPCIPDVLETPSYKFSTTQRGTFVCGTSGFGFVACNPYIYPNTTSNLVYSTALFELNDIVKTGTGVQPSFDSRFPYDGDIPGVRLVGAGLRIGYIGQQLQLGGIAVPFSAISHFDSCQNMGIQPLQARTDATTFDVKRGWTSVVLRNHTYSSQEYGEGVLTPIDDPATKMLLAFGVQSTPGNTFRYEIVRHFEAVPMNDVIPPSLSKSNSDPVGQGVVRDFVSSVMASEAGQYAMDQFKHFIKTKAVAGVSTYLPNIPGYNVPYLENLL